MARAKRKLPAKPAAFISPQHRSHFCRRHPIPEHKAPAADNTHPTKTSRLGQTAPTDTRTQKKPAAAPNTAGRFCFFAPPQSLLLPSSDTRTQSPRRRQYTPHKNLTARSNGTDRCPNTKNPLPLRTPPAAFISPHHRGHFCPVIRYPNTKPPPPTIHTPQKPHGSVKRHRPIPEHKKTRCRSEHHRPFPLSLKKPQRCLNAIVQRQPPPAGAQHHLTQPNPNISGRRFTAFFALRCL